MSPSNSIPIPTHDTIGQEFSARDSEDAQEAADVNHLQWPCERFYWGLLDPSAVGQAGGTAAVGGKFHERLGYLFESVLPGIAIEEVHAAYRRVNGKYLACGLAQSVLEEEVPHGALTLSPTELPPFLQHLEHAERLLPTLNLLTGAFTPKSISRLQRRWLLQGAILIVACALVVVIGFERRARHIQEQIASVERERDKIYDHVLGAGALSAGGQPPALRMLAELRQLEQTRSVDRHDGQAGQGDENCAKALSELMARWPLELNAQTESISITPTSITVRGQVPTMADAQALADSLATLPGWQVAQPQSESRRDQVDVTLRLDRAPHGRRDRAQSAGGST